MSMRKIIDSKPLYSHYYIRGKNVNTCTPQDIAECKASLTRCLFGEHKVFEEVSVSDILLRGSGTICSLCRHPGIVLSAVIITSFGTKIFSIPIDQQPYYPGYSKSDKIVLALTNVIDDTDDSKTV